MSAGRLRQAATLIRLSANGAVPVLPKFNHWGVTRDPLGTHVENGDGKGRIAMLVGADRLDDRGADTAQHIALWSPPVALAVADWLDLAGSDLWAWGPLCACEDGCDECDDITWMHHARKAIALADLILGETP